jgi:hypothetical protein
MAMIVLSSPATLTGLNEKKTGPSRFRPLFLGGWVDTNFTDWHELFRSQKSQKQRVRISESGAGIKDGKGGRKNERFQVPTVAMRLRIRRDNFQRAKSSLTEVDYL